MLIPSARAELIKNYQNALFYNPTEPKHQRQYVFYILLRPIVLWVKELMIKDFNLEPSEAESELYIFCCDVFSGFKPDKSSIIPYLQKGIEWKISRLVRKLLKSQRHLLNTINDLQESYLPQEEYYWDPIKLLTTDRYIKNLFTYKEKYVIYSILMSDDNKLTKKDLSETFGISRPTMTKILNNIKDRLYNWRV